MLTGKGAGGELGLEVGVGPDGAAATLDDDVDGEERLFVELDRGAVFVLLQSSVSFVFEASGIFEALGRGQVCCCHFLAHGFFDRGVVGAFDVDFKEAFDHAKGLEEALLQGFGYGIVFKGEGVGIL